MAALYDLYDLTILRGRYRTMSVLMFLQNCEQ